MQTRLLSTLLFFSLLLLGGCSLFSDDKLEENPDPASSSKLESDLLARGLIAYEEGLFSIARERFTELKDSYPASPYVPFAELKIADTHFAARDYETAYSSYDEFLRNFSGSESAHYAFFQTALSQLRQYRGSLNEQAPLTNAVKLFGEFVSKYPKSYLVPKAKEYNVLCHEALANHEIEVSRFYLKQDQIDAAASRLAEAKQRFATTSAISSAVNDRFSDLENSEKFFALAKEKEKALRLTSTAPKLPSLVAAYADSK